MPISDEHEALMIHVPKNAGTSIEKALNMDVSGHHRWYWYKNNHPEKYHKYAVFAVSRNPFDRVVSCYEYAKQEESYWHSANNPRDAVYGKHPDYDKVKGRSFRETIDIIDDLDHHGWEPQHPYLYADDEFKVDYMLRMENLDEDIKKVVGDVDIPELNKSRKTRQYRSYYDDKLRRKVADYYEKDFELFDYSF